MLLQSFYLVRVCADRFAENLGTLLGANLTGMSLLSWPPPLWRRPWGS